MRGKETIYIKDVYPEKAQYLSGDEIKIYVEAFNETEKNIDAVLEITIRALDEIIAEQSANIVLKAGCVTEHVFCFEQIESEWQGYGADVVMIAGGEGYHALSTAFDVVASWKYAPRYGFLSDFSIGDEQDPEDIRQMAKYHLNVIQFYDWMYRHDKLMPEEEYFIDPLSRKLSLKAIKEKIRLCHKYGMKALAYSAIYAGSKDFFDEHKDWALYDNAGNAHSLGGEWLFIMNIAPESPWVKHIINEYKDTLSRLDFDGIHMDTYGFPKKAYSLLGGRRKLENLDQQFRMFINKVREELEPVREDLGLSFNAVGNWSIETVAPSRQDIIYIEVWAPYENYIHLYELISRAKELGQKPVTLAAYLPAYLENSGIKPEHAENSLLLSSAVIFASGGYRILLGENNGVLADPYFVLYGKLRPGFERTVRNYYDFIVRYANLLYDPQLKDLSMTHANGINEEYRFENGAFSSFGEPDKIWTIIKEKPGYKIINLVNLTGIKSPRWNEAKENKPTEIKNIIVRALVEEEVEDVFVASPDINNGFPQKLEYEYENFTRGRALKFTIPNLHIWDMVYIRVVETDINTV